MMVTWIMVVAGEVVLGFQVETLRRLVPHDFRVKVWLETIVWELSVYEWCLKP